MHEEINNKSNADILLDSALHILKKHTTQQNFSLHFHVPPYKVWQKSNETDFWSENFFKRAEQKFYGYWIRLAPNGRIFNTRVKSARVTAIWIGDRYIR